jgi:WD repeat-containing protein 1 (actin-interacting protein 1)
MAPSVDASNSCIPLSSPLSSLSPPLPTTVRGEPTVLDGSPGRLNADYPLILYGSGRLVIVRELPLDVPGGGSTDQTKHDGNKRQKTFVYRGHMATVTCAKFSPSGSYVASADVRGKLRVWSWDNEEHLCKLDLNVLTGPIRCIAWDFESKRVSLFKFCFL